MIFFFIFCVIVYFIAKGTITLSLGVEFNNEEILEYKKSKSI